MKDGSSSGGALRVSVGILSSRLTGLLRDIFIARYGGVGIGTDVLYAALRGPNFLQNLLGEQALSASLIPVYSGLIARGQVREARSLANAVIGILALSVTVVVSIGVLVAPFLVSVLFPGFRGKGAEVHALAVDAVRILFPMSGLLVLASWCLSILNSHRRFFLPYFAPVLWNLSIIGALLIASIAFGAGHLGPRQFVLTACVGALCGGLLQLLVQLPTTLGLLGSLRPSLRWSEDLSETIRRFLPTMTGRGVVQLAAYLDYFLASLLASGALAAVSLSQRLYLLPIALFGSAVAVAELPSLARLPEDERGTQLIERVATSVRRSAFLTVPTVVGFMGFGLILVLALFGGGEFQRDDGWVVYLTLCAYSAGMLASMCSRLLQNAYFVHGDTKSPAVVAMVRVALSFGMALPLVFLLDRFALSDLVPSAPVSGEPLFLGALGLAISSAVGGWFELTALLFRFRRRHGAMQWPWRRLALMLGLALVSLLPAMALWWLLADLNVRILAPLLIGALALPYCGVSLLLRLEEASFFWLRARGLLRRSVPG